jgi:hypothetical protein
LFGGALVVSHRGGPSFIFCFPVAIAALVVYVRAICASMRALLSAADRPGPAERGDLFANALARVASIAAAVA